MTQNTRDNPPASDQRSSSNPFMDLPPATFDYTQEQLGGGRYQSPPVELTPSRLRSKLKAMARDIGIIKGATLRRQAFQHPSEDSTQSDPPAVGHVGQDVTSTSSTSSLMLNVANSRHTSPFPPAPAAPAQSSDTSSLTLNVTHSRHASPFPPAPTQMPDLFYGSSMSHQAAWMEQHSSDADAYGMMGGDTFTAGLLENQTLGMVGADGGKVPDMPIGPQHQLTTQDMSRLPPQPSFHFPPSSMGPLMPLPRERSQDPVGSGFTQDLSGRVSPFVLCPVPSSPQDHAPPLPTTNLIPPTPLQHGASKANSVISTNTTTTCALPAVMRDLSPQLDLAYYPSAAVSNRRFPEENEPITHHDGPTVAGRRSTELNATLDTGFAEVERHFLNLSTSTTLPINQLINSFLKSRGCTVTSVNYWNLYANYFKDNVQQELARIGREAPEGGGTPSATMRTQCYDKFKVAYPDTYQDILSMHEEVSLLGSSPQTIVQRGQTFQKHYRRVVNILESGSVKFGFEAAIVLCGKVVNEDGSLGHCYNTPGAAGFWETRCRASDDAIIGHLKAHVYNTTSLSTVDDAFKDDIDANLEDASTTNNLDQSSDIVEGRDDGLKWVKNQIIKQVARLARPGTGFNDKNFPWKLMPAALVEANLCIKGYPAHKCLLPGETHNEISKKKGIAALTQKEVTALVDALKAGTMVISKSEYERPAVIASEKPVVTGEAPPSDWAHSGARQLFLDGHTDYNGPARLKPSGATTKIKKGNKVPKAPPLPSIDESDNDDQPGPSAPKRAPQAILRKPNMRMEVIPPPFPFPLPLPSRPFKVVPRPAAPQARSDIIELTSTDEKPSEEPDTEYEEAARGKRKLKSANTSRASKKLAPSTNKTDTSKAGKKGVQTKNNPQPKVQASNPSPTKGGPLSPLTVGSSSVAASPESTVMRLRDGPSNDSEDMKKRVKPRPATKGSKRTMKRALRTVYSNSDSESEEDKDAKAEATTNCAISESTNAVHIQADVSEGVVLHNKVPAGDTQEEELASAVTPSIPNQQPDVPRIPIQQPDIPRAQTPRGSEPSHDAPHLQTPRDSEPPRDGPRPQIPRGSEPLHDPPRNLREIPHDDHCDPGEALYNHHEHSRNPREPLQYPHEPLQYPREPLRRDPHGTLRNPRDDIQQDPRYPSRANSHDPMHPYDQHYHGRHREVQNQREATPIIDRDSLHPHDTFYPRDSRPTRYLGGYPPPDNYGSTEGRTESDLNTRDSSPASDLLGHFSHGEQERSYPSRYSPVCDPGYIREAGYSRRDDLDERGHLLAPYRPVGPYRNGGYPQDRRYHNSRWTDHDDPYVRDAVPRSSRDAHNQPRGPPS
ncbi:hypothetical protein C8R48DRAFT_775782 [Suillus tomentosus]|nr:hypothetical protein C8R48DRAFT_775782 [Suillus tomentosus]